MTERYASGRAIDLILVLLVLATAAPLILWRRRACGVPPRVLVRPILATGATLLLTVRAALAGARSRA